MVDSLSRRFHLAYAPQAYFGIQDAPAGGKTKKLDKRLFVKGQVPDFARMTRFYEDGDVSIARCLVKFRRRSKN